MGDDRKAWARFLGVTPPTGPNKYGAKTIVVDGIRFDSRKEARRYRDLQLLAAAGVIRDLETQPVFPLDVIEHPRQQPTRVPRVIRCGKYTADFRYTDCATGAVVVEDVKSGPTRTTATRLRKRLVEAIYGIVIIEV